jgi:hypothetical protein
MRNPGDVLDWLNVAAKTHSDTYEYSVILDAIAEITRLRATQFRWVPVGGEKFLTHRSLVHYPNGNSHVQGAGGFLDNATHYIQIPPLPGKSQEVIDADRCNEYIAMHKHDTGGPSWIMQCAYFAGLKAAREEQERFAMSHNGG